MADEMIGLLAMEGCSRTLKKRLCCRYAMVRSSAEGVSIILRSWALLLYYVVYGFENRYRTGQMQLAVRTECEASVAAQAGGEWSPWKIT